MNRVRLSTTVSAELLSSARGINAGNTDACPTNIRGLASEVALDPDFDPIPRRSAVNMDSVESVSIAVLVSRLGRLSDARMRDACAALEMAVACGR